MCVAFKHSRHAASLTMDEIPRELHAHDLTRDISAVRATPDVDREAEAVSEGCHDVDHGQAQDDAAVLVVPALAEASNERLVAVPDSLHLWPARLRVQVEGLS